METRTSACHLLKDGVVRLPGRLQLDDLDEAIIKN
jgi:hypothetical protein